MNFNIKKIQIKRALNKKLSDDLFSILEKASKHPASKIAMYQDDLIKPHSLNEIKNKIGYEGNDKTFRETISNIPFISEVQQQRSYKGWGRPRIEDLKKDEENRVKRYQINPDKIKLTEEWFWETVEGQIGLRKEDIISEVDSVFKTTEFFEWLSSLTEEERKQTLNEIAEFLKWIHSLSKEERKQFYKTVFNKNWSSLSNEERLGKLEQIKKDS